MEKASEIKVYEVTCVQLSEQDSFKELIKFQIQRNNINISKFFLSLLDKIREDDYNINEANFKYFRKSILDISNQNTRDILSQLDNMEISAKKK